MSSSKGTSDYHIIRSTKKHEFIQYLDNNIQETNENIKKQQNKPYIDEREEMECEPTEKCYEYNSTAILSKYQNIPISFLVLAVGQNYVIQTYLVSKGELYANFTRSFSNEVCMCDWQPKQYSNIVDRNNIQKYMKKKKKEKKH